MNFSITDLYVAAILEGIVALLMPVFDADVVGMHEKIVGVCHFDITDIDIGAMPESLFSVRDVYIAQNNAVHFSEHLWRVNLSVGHLKIAGIPQCGAGAGGEE